MEKILPLAGVGDPWRVKKVSGAEALVTFRHFFSSLIVMHPQRETWERTQRRTTLLSYYVLLCYSTVVLEAQICYLLDSNDQFFL